MDGWNQELYKWKKNNYINVVITILRESEGNDAWVFNGQKR